MENPSGKPGTKERCQAAFKRDLFSGRRKAFGGQGGKAQPEEPGLPQRLEANLETYTRRESRRKGQRSGGGGGVFALLCSAPALSRDEARVSVWKKFLWRRCVPLLNCPHGPQRVRSAHQDRGRDNAYKLLSSHL